LDASIKLFPTRAAGLMPGNIRDILFGSSTFRLNWTLESMMSVAHPAMILTVWPSSFLDLILQLANLP
jgi:hypothetical protein